MSEKVCFLCLEDETKESTLCGVPCCKHKQYVHNECFNDMINFKKDDPQNFEMNIDESDQTNFHITCDTCKNETWFIKEESTKTYRSWRDLTYKEIRPIWSVAHLLINVFLASWLLYNKSTTITSVFDYLFLINIMHMLTYHLMVCIRTIFNLKDSDLTCAIIVSYTAVLLLYLLKHNYSIPESDWAKQYAWYFVKLVPFTLFKQFILMIWVINSIFILACKVIPAIIAENLLSIHADSENYKEMIKKDTESLIKSSLIMIHNYHFYNTIIYQEIPYIGFWGSMVFYYKYEHILLTQSTYQKEETKFQNNIIKYSCYALIPYILSGYRHPNLTLLYQIHLMYSSCVSWKQTSKDNLNGFKEAYKYFMKYLKRIQYVTTYKYNIIEDPNSKQDETSKEISKNAPDVASDPDSQLFSDDDT